MIHTFLPLLLTAVVLIAILCQKVGRWKLPVWLIAISAAVLLITTGQLSITKAIQSIDTNVILYMFGLFIITRSLEQSHALTHATLMLFSQAKYMQHVVLILIFASGLSSALLMNDTIAVIGVPVILLLAKQQSIDHRPLLITLALSITLGSTFSPIGNPQNMIIASQGMSFPFITFFSHLFIPGIISLGALYACIRIYYQDLFNTQLSSWTHPLAIDKRNAWLGGIALCLLIVLIIFSECLPEKAQKLHLDLGNAALVSCLPVLLFSQQRQRILCSIDWRTLLYFISLFILMAGVWNSGVFQPLIHQYNAEMQHQGIIITTSLLLSQLLSNVPLVLLYLPQLPPGSTMQLTLALGSTLAGNLLVTGAASNMIIIQTTQLRGKSLFSFRTFTLLGATVTLINLLLYYLIQLL